MAKVNANEPGCKLYALHHGEAPGTYVFMDGRPEVQRLKEVE